MSGGGLRTYGFCRSALIERYINKESCESFARYVAEKIKKVKEDAAEAKIAEVPARGLKRKMEGEVEEKPIYRIPKKKRVEETAEVKEEENGVTTEELARRLKALPHKPTAFDAMELIHSLGSYSAAQMEEAEILIGHKMQRVEEIWKLMTFIKFGFAKGKSKNVRKLYKELLEKEKKKVN